MKRRQFLASSAGLVGATICGIGRAATPCPTGQLSAAGGGTIASSCEETQIGKSARRLAEASPAAPAWSGPDIGLSSLNAKVHYWGEPSPGSPVVGGRPPFSAPNGVRDDYNILDWPGKALWDSRNGNWWFSGGPTGNQDAASPTVVQYRLGDDRFLHWQGPASKQSGIWPPSGHAHSFDAADLDVEGRRIWRHLAPHASEPFKFKLGWFDIDTFESGRVDGDNYQNDGYPTISFMPDNRLLHVIRPQPGTSLNIRRFNVDTAAWSAKPLLGPPGSAGPSCYFRGAVFFSTNRRHFSAIRPDGTVEEKAATPITMARPVNGDASYALLIPLRDFIYAFCGNGDIWRYDPVSDKWGSAPYGRIPWAWGETAYSETGRHYMTQACVGPVPTLGVALFCLAQRNSPAGKDPARAFVWKP